MVVMSEGSLETASGMFACEDDAAARSAPHLNGLTKVRVLESTRDIRTRDILTFIHRDMIIAISVFMQTGSYSVTARATDICLTMKTAQPNLVMADYRRHSEYDTQRTKTSSGKNRQSGHRSLRYMFPSHMLYMTWSRREA